MRNLTLANLESTSLPNSKLSATTLDLDQNVLYAASERLNPDGEAEIEVWKIEEDGPSNFAMFTTIASSQNASAPQVVAFRVIPEIQKISMIVRSGDIATIDFESSLVEVEGTVEPGILAASWSPDDSLLALVTGEGKLILMTTAFDVLSEVPVETSDFGEEAPINVGWGSKQTQFHGSLGKAAAQAAAPQAIGSSPDDDEVPRISWRGDGAFFVVSFLSPASPNNNLRRRTLRVYNREGALQSTSEAVAGLEHTLSWRPSGNLIVGTQRFGFEGGGAGKAGRHDVVFFERNGLRHGDFGIRAADLASKESSDNLMWGYRVKEVGWSSDSNVLSLWVEREEGDIVQLWTTGNYHWYLKQEIAAPQVTKGKPGRFTSVSWHPEQALQLILTTETSILRRTYAWETLASPSQPPLDSGSVAVSDGTEFLLTPFRVQNVPPPMCSHRLPIADNPDRPFAHRTPIHASFAAKSDTLAILWENGFVEIWDLKTRLEGGRGKIMNPEFKFSSPLHDDYEGVRSARQVHIWGGDGEEEFGVVVLWTDLKQDVISVFTAKTHERWPKITNVEVGKSGCRLVETQDGVSVQTADGEILNYDFEAKVFQSTSAHLPEFCLQSQSAVVGECDSLASAIYTGLGSSGKLYIASPDSYRILATNANSFTIASGFIIFTTTSHEAKFIPLSSLKGLLESEDANTNKVPEVEWEKRRVERGSRIVVAVPSSMSLVLQMPRGNLETINPRPLVMEVVRQDIDAGNYRKAFFACRKHRIDLNVLVDHDEEKFMERIPSFVDQVHEVDHLNLLLTGVGQGKQTPETIAKICDAIREQLEQKDLKKYVNTILTAYVVKTPPDHESGLSVLLKLKETNPDIVEDAVKYIIFLVDADRLFDTALGMYDFSLVLMIAQHAQKDPREYLPFLRELRALEKFYQRFRIDDHLKRHERALQNLSQAGDEYFEKAMSYTELHRLHESALKIWKGTDKYNNVLQLYGDYLFERREFRQAASIFLEAKAYQKAMVAHEKALEWQELFLLADKIDLPEDDIVAAGYRVAEDLGSKKRHAEAGRVLLDYAKNVREAIIAFVSGNHFSEARRIIAIQKKPELIEDIVYPGALESIGQVMEDVGECQEQLRKQVNRLRELRIKKIEEPEAFYAVEDPNLHNVDVMTDVSMAPTTFTRYTVAPSTASRTSKRSSRSKRKLERKVGSGRKGTVDEEEYLLKSVTKLATRFATIQVEAGSLLPHLLRFADEHRSEGQKMQKRVLDFGEEMKIALEEIWFKPPEEITPDTWAARMEEVERDRKTNSIDKIPKPTLGNNDSEWKINLFDFS